MVFSEQLQFIAEAAPTFGPFNRVSDLVRRSARGAIPEKGSPETGDGSQLVNVLRDTPGGIASLGDMKMVLLKGLYKLCFGGGMHR